MTDISGQDKCSFGHSDPSPGVRLGIVIPTINRADLLAENIESLISQQGEIERILIIDNGGQHLPFDHPKIEIENSGKNLGVAASWNLGIARLLEDGAMTHVVVLNDDIVLGPDQIRRIKSTISEKSDAWFFVGPYFWSVWVISRQGAEEMLGADGYLFDETFFPAYFEDNDFHHRFASRFPDRFECNLSALEPAVKRNSASAEREPTLLGNFKRNSEYFVSKWAGPPREEQRHPKPR